MSLDDEIPEEFVCPITQQVFKDPVMDMHGRTYERNAILSWLVANGTCPLTRRTMKASDLIPNVMMQTRIRLWQRETGRKVFPTRSWDGAKDVLGYGEDPTEAESGSDNDMDDFFSQTPVYAIAIISPTPTSEHERRYQSSRNSRRRHRDRRGRNLPVEEPTPSVSAPPRRFRLFRRRGSL
mmetsp:Transcript_76057/g.114517  ORF Transcript_76057/g.114517 Transcript_76057/m.114517 type:complete len:181 (-) Transcript_76057:141-683(-)